MIDSLNFTDKSTGSKNAFFDNVKQALINFQFQMTIKNLGNLA